MKTHHPDLYCCVVVGLLALAGCLQAGAPDSEDHSALESHSAKQPAPATTDVPSQVEPSASPQGAAETNGRAPVVDGGGGHETAARDSAPDTVPQRPPSSDASADAARRADAVATSSSCPASIRASNACFAHDPAQTPGCGACVQRECCEEASRLLSVAGGAELVSCMEQCVGKYGYESVEGSQCASACTQKFPSARDALLDFVNCETDTPCGAACVAIVN